MDANFVVEHDGHGRLDFDVRSGWSSAMRDAFMSSGADGLVANYARGFAGHDLEFIRGLPLRRLRVLARTIRDLSPVYDLSGTLQELHVDAGETTRVDLAALPHLRALSCAWTQVVDTIGECNQLDYLAVGEYDPSDLTPLSHLSSLQFLQMKGRPAVRALDGVEAMPWLSHLGIYLAPLEDTSALRRISSPVLTELHLAACRRISSLSDMAVLSSLRVLDVSEGGDLDSLQPIAELKQLERLYLYDTTRIVDGDLTPLLGLPKLKDLRLMNRRHYRPSAGEVKTLLGLE